MSAYRKFVDTLQNEPRTPTPPKPPKTPKANPSEPVSLPVLGGLDTLGAPPIKNESSPHAATPPPLSFSARAILDDFKNEGAANGKQGSDMPLAGTAIIAPGKWVERIALPASSEPGFSEPWPPRRGRIESREHAAAFLLRMWCLGQLWLRRQFAWRENGAVVLRRSPRSRRDSAVSLRCAIQPFFSATWPRRVARSGTLQMTEPINGKQTSISAAMHGAPPMGRKVRQRRNSARLSSGTSS
jgi:hypothetical protein